MNSTIEYGCFRYFLVPYEEIQTSLLDEKLPNKKMLIEKILTHNETTEMFNNISDDKYKIYLVDKINDDNFLIQLGKRSTLKRSADTGNGFKDYDEDNHPFVHIFVNTKEQILLFEKKPSVFKNYKASANAFTKYITDKIDNLGYEFKCEEINSSHKFWSIVDNASSITSVTLTLYSPNLFDGITPAEEAARDLEQATNSTENILTFKNKHGKIKLIKERLNSYIDYISSGGGRWKINAIFTNKKKRNFSSKDSIKTVNFPEDLTNRSSKALNEYVPKIIQSVNHKPGDDVNESINHNNI